MYKSFKDMTIWQEALDTLPSPKPLPLMLRMD